MTAIGNVSGEPARAVAETVPAAADIAPTPIWISPRVQWALVIGFIALGLLAIKVAPGVFQTFLLGGFLALALSFPVRLLSRALPRAAAIPIVLLGLILITFVGAVALAVQLQELVSATPAMVDDASQQTTRLLERLEERDLLPIPAEEVVPNLRQDLFESLQRQARTILDRAFSIVSGTLGYLLQAFAVLVIAAYLLAGGGRMRNTLVSLLPDEYEPDVHLLARQMKLSLDRYLGGLLLSMTIQGAAAAIVLGLMGIPYWLLLGVWTAATAILPFIGAFLGAIPAIVIAATISPWHAVGVAIFYLVMNQIEGNLLTPRIQGDAVGVHPLLIFLGILFGASVYGFIGALMAVPALALGKVLIEFFAARLKVRRPTAWQAG